MERGCETCKHFSDWTGECKKGILDQFQTTRCDTSKCTEYKADPFYLKLENEGQ